MMVLWFRLKDTFWAVPLGCAIVAAGLGLAFVAIDQSLDTSFSLPFLFTGGPEGARSLLSAITTSMISFTALVFSITIVVLQLSSSQFSPRVLRSFLRDRFNQLALGVFIATFVYALFVLRAVRGTAQVDPFVPQLGMTVALAFVLASVVVFLVYIHHIAQSVRVVTIITRVAAETRVVLDRRHPPDGDPRSPLPLPIGTADHVAAAEAGVVQRVEDDALYHLAKQYDMTVCLVHQVGDFVPGGAPLLEVYGPDPVEHRQLRSAVQLGREPSTDQDFGFGLRQLVDIAERALSPGINDPTTAVQVIDQLHDVLRRLATRHLAPRQRVGDDGRLLVHVPEPSFADYLALVIDEIARTGTGIPRVQQRLRAMVRDLQEVALPVHQPALAAAFRELVAGHPSVT